jgi:ubiquinone/menaquinone biosynthesis C-methylase UbiE
MASILKSLKLLSDPNRLRILLLLQREELSVAELQDILAAGQSTLSTHLAQLKQAGLLEDRRTGKNIFYRYRPAPALHEILEAGSVEIPEAASDQQGLELAIARRKDKTRAYFDELAGKFGRDYVPGRSWKGVAEMLLQLLPPLVIADLGAGEGTLSQLLAQRAKQVIAVDDSGKMVAFGSELASKNGLVNLEYRKGDLESLPIEDASVDLALFSQSLHHAQHPQTAIAEAWRILKPGARVAILDLRKHNFEEARELYADLWLGFTEVELQNFLRHGGFQNIAISAVHRETEAPHFETLLAVGQK